MVSCRRVVYGVRHFSPRILLYTSLGLVLFIMCVFNHTTSHFHKLHVKPKTRRKTASTSLNNVGKLEKIGIDEMEEISEYSEPRNINSFKHNQGYHDISSADENYGAFKYGDQDKEVDYFDGEKAFNQVDINSQNALHHLSVRKRPSRVHNQADIRTRSSKSKKVPSFGAGDLHMLQVKHRNNVNRNQRKNIILQKLDRSKEDRQAIVSELNVHSERRPHVSDRVPREPYKRKDLALYDDELRNVYIVKNSTSSSTTTTAVIHNEAHAHRNTLSAKEKRADIRQCNKVRMQRLRNRCRELAVTPLEQRSDEEVINLATKIIADDRHRVLINALPKTGCSSWKMVMLNNSGLSLDKPGQHPSGGINNWETLRNYGLHDLSTLPIEHIRYRLKYYYSILTVRHPFERLESVFREKFSRHNKYYQGKIGNKIISKYRKKVQNDNISTEFYNVTFEEFLRFTLESNVTDRHWMSIWDLANPCVLPYQYIAKTETASRDMDYISATKLSYGMSGGAYHYNPTQTEEQVEIHSSKVLPLFSHLPHKSQSDLILGVLERYMDDMELFGYRIRKEGSSIIADCEMYNAEGMCC